MDALIGHTGYIGSELARQHMFGGLFNSRNIDEIDGGSFDTVVCAAAPGSMLEANRLPDQDAGTIDRLIGHLRSIEARHVVLISTIAVLKGFAAADEEGAEYETDLAYGINRRRLETCVLDHFDRPLVLRLPALFGGTLRKNFLFDMLNPMPTMLTRERIDTVKQTLGSEWAPVIDTIYAWNDTVSLFVIDRAKLDGSGRRTELESLMKAANSSAIQFTHRDSHFQYYDIGQLWSDIRRAMTAGVSVLHLAPVPVAAGDIHEAVLGTPMPVTAARLHREDMRTGHADLWGRTGPYSADANDVIAGIQAFFARTRAA